MFCFYKQFNDFCYAVYRLSTWNWEDEPLCVDLSPKVDILAQLSAGHINSLRSNFISKFRSIKREVQSSGAKHVLPPLCIAALYNDDSPAGSVKSRLADYFIDPRSLHSLEPVTISILLTAAATTANKLLSSLVSPNRDLETNADGIWAGLEQPILSSCNVLLKFRKTVHCSDSSSASAGASAVSQCISLSGAAMGPSAARVKVFSNMPSSQLLQPSSLIIRCEQRLTLFLCYLLMYIYFFDTQRSACCYIYSS